MAKGKPTRRILARLHRGTVAELLEEHPNVAFEDAWTPDFLASCVDVTDADPRPEIGWVRLEGEENLSPPPPPPPPAPEVAKRRALMQGPRIGRGRNRALFSGPDLWERMRDVALHVTVFKEFPGGAANLEWPSDPPVTFGNVDSFLAAFKALSTWRDAWHQHALGRGAAPDRDVEE